MTGAEIKSYTLYSHGAEIQPTALPGYSGKSSNIIFLPIKKTILLTIELPSFIATLTLVYAVRFGKQ
jgi:hypothetical protein